MPNQVRTHPASVDLMPTRDVALLTGVDVATVNRWARTGRLVPVAKGPGRNGANLFARSDVAALVAAGRLSIRAAS